MSFFIKNHILRHSPQILYVLVHSQTLHIETNSIVLKGCETPYTNVIFKYMDIKFNLGRECHLKNVHVYHTKLSYDFWN